jgi:hypothetical protein
MDLGASMSADMRTGMRAWRGLLAALLLGLCLLVVVPSASAYGETHGIYTITAAPHYQHPVTGVIEDSGQNLAIGQGMTESVLGGQALLEVDGQGRHYITVRYSLMDNIKDARLSYQKDAESEWVPTEFSVTREDMDEGIADLRFAVPDENVIVRAELYAIPMGRVVVFFADFHDPVPGSGDFVTSITVDEELAATQAAQAAQTAQGDNSPSGSSAGTANAAGTQAQGQASPSTPLDPSAGLTVYRVDDEQTATAAGAGSGVLGGLDEVALLALGVSGLIVLGAALGGAWLWWSRRKAAVAPVSAVSVWPSENAETGDPSDAPSAPSSAASFAPSNTEDVQT